MASELLHTEQLERIFDSNVSDAGFLQQMAVLGLNQVHYANKRVLDIGSGKTNRLCNEAPEFIGKATLISVNPLLAFDEQCIKHGVDKSTHRQSVAALAQGWLPFMDESFDTIVSVLGVPNALTTEELPDFYNEVWRILAPGGTASFWPLAHHHTQGELMIATDFARVENVRTEILELLPEPYCHTPQRAIITKPDNSTNLPATIAYLE